LHAVLMFAPASHNFPDSLYTVAILGSLIGLFSKEGIRFGLLGVATQSLRWPGGILSSVFALLYGYFNKEMPIKGLQYLWIGIFLGGIIAGLAMLTGDAKDLLFILYFETFPEHWHGNYEAGHLLSRIPGFYQKWILYSGGTFLLTVPFLWHKRGSVLRIMLGGTLIYSLILATIDHDPTHYFLPLIAITGPCFIYASSIITQPLQQRTFLGLGIFGSLFYLCYGMI